jgi:hypothetical protein
MSLKLPKKKILFAEHAKCLRPARSTFGRNEVEDFNGLGLQDQTVGHAG